MLSSELDQIPGIGPKTIETLLKKFGSLDKIRSASLSSLEEVVGASKSQKIRKYLKISSGGE